MEGKEDFFEGERGGETGVTFPFHFFRSKVSTSNIVYLFNGFIISTASSCICSFFILHLHWLPGDH